MSKPTSSTPRAALAELPALPLHQRPKNVELKTTPAGVPKVNSNQSLTPPSTPPKLENSRAPISADAIENRLSIGLTLGLKSLKIIEHEAEQHKTEGEHETKLKWYNKKYELHEELGHGVWSNVYRATEHREATTIPGMLPLSPPTSPTNDSAFSSRRILAIKKPSRRDAHRILENEARILTYLHSYNEASSYLVPFYGFDVAQNSIVLDVVPMSLETYAKSARKRPLATNTMFDPLIGAETWADLAECLIRGLAFLHSKGCVHGDIKPANILLRLDEKDKMIPLYCDFSSSRVISSVTVPEDVGEVSAVTADYTSPELLELLHKRNDERAIATFASDVFALAVTLLYAATGESPYACARMELQKLGMAKEGVPLEYARRGEQASRVMEGRAVGKMLEGALAKDPEKRLEVEGWRCGVRDVVENWRNGGWLRGG